MSVTTATATWVSARRALIGLCALNFFLAAAQTGFGPFLPVFLTQLHWTQADIGFALSLGTVAAIATQLPGGALVDRVDGKRALVTLALAATGLSALGFALFPRPGDGFVAQVWVAQALHAAAASVLTPAVAALTLMVSGHEGFGAQLGSNARYASVGAGAAAALLGAFATWQSERAVFLVTALLVIPAIGALCLLETPLQPLRPRRIDHPALHPRPARRRGGWRIFLSLHLHVFAVAVMLFQLGNAAMLPLALNDLALRGQASGFLVSATIMVPSAVVAIASPWVGRRAQRVGRRGLLLVAFAALALRGVLLMLRPGPAALVGIELLDGASGAVFGLMLPLVAADLTRDTGYFNLAIGALGLAVSVGATISTLLAGLVFDAAGARAAFLALAAAGAAGFAVVRLLMPETRPAIMVAEPPSVP